MIKESPKTIKYGRCFRLKIKNKDIRSAFLNVKNYKYGLKALEYGWITSLQLNSILRLIKIILKKKIKIKVNCSLIIPITKKPLETRMGSGKAERKFWRCPIRKGMILFELSSVSELDAYFIFYVIGHRLSFLTKKVKLIF